MKTKAPNTTLWIFAQTFFLIIPSLEKLQYLKKKKILSDNGLLHSHVICRVFPSLAYRFTFFFFFFSQILAYLHHLELSRQWFSSHCNHKYVILLNEFKIKMMYLLFYQSFLPSRQLQLLFFSFVTIDYSAFLQIPTVMWRGTT